MSHEGESATNPASTSTPAILSKKKRIRAGYRAYITKLISDSRDLLDKGPFLRTQAENLKALLKERKKLLRDFDDEILDLVTEEEIEPEIFDCEEKQVQIQSIITELESRQLTVSDTPSVALAQSAVASVSQNSSIDIVNLPKLHLSNFNGDPKKWQEWWDSFEIIHKNPSISKVNKFRHLRTLLDGRAAAAVSGIQTTDANYDTAIEVLKERFAQKQMIINSHMEALMNLPNVSSVKDVTTLRKLVDDIDINVRSLKSLGLEIKEYGALLNPLVMGKLPEEIRLALTKEMKGKEWELGLVLEILKAELGAREQCAHVKSPASVPSVKPRMQNFSTTSALVNNSNKITCSFCKGLHLSVKCSIVTDKGQRKAILRRQGRCFVCLKKGHISRDCTSKISCHICKQRHHASICDKGDIFTPTGSRGQPRVFTNPVQWQSNPPHLSPRVTNESQPNSSGSNSCNTTMTMHVDTKTSVLLQTAKAYISAAQCPEKTAVARLILDSGSKHSYISEGLRSALSLPTVGKETLTIKTFGDSEGTVRTCDIVQFCVRSPYNSICLYVSAYVVPIVCAPIKNQAINFAIRNYPHLTGLWFADFPANIDDALNCEVLIGSNFYWHFMSGQCRRGERGPIALESCLGWILSGPVYDCPASASTEVNLTDTHVLTLASNERGEEHLLVQQDLWDHCSGADNPADIPTRNTGIVNFMNKGHWLQGPEWLSMDEEHWPKRNLPKEPSIDCIKEMKPTTAVNMLVQSENHYQISKVIDCNRFSSYTRLLRVTAIVFRFIENCRERVKNFNALTAQDLERAETCWIKDVQSTITEEKLGDLKKHLGNTKDKKGIIRCYGRLNNSTLPIETKNPVLLPKNHYLTQLIIWDCHCRVLHNGTKETLQELRSRFWVNQGRQLVKRILRNCKLCKRIQGLSYGSPKSGQLPEFRVREEHAFSAVGIDFAGPLYVRTLDATKKVYLALFTCGTTRAVHLELVPDLTAETFMLCFRRFVSRRGIPYTIATDNAKTFKTFSKTLIKLLKSSDMKSYLAERRITWRFNLSKAPWWGGFYERLIALVKTCLKKAIGTAKLSSDELHTIIVEIEGVLNSRPLTYIYPRDLEEPLTPAHLLMGRRLLQLPSDVMMNQDEHIRNRAFWKLGRVEELITDNDDEVRGVRIRLGNGHLIDRPIQKVFPLELTTPTPQEPVIMDKELITERPVRAAKTIAKERLEIIDQLEDDIE